MVMMVSVLDLKLGNKISMSALTTSVNTQCFIEGNMAGKRNSRPLVWKGEVKLSLFTDNMTNYIENFMEYAKLL